MDSMNDTEISCLCLNLWNGGRLWPELSEFLSSHQSDLMMFQEAYDGQDRTLEPRLQTTRLLAKLFPEYYQHFFAGYLDTRSSGHFIEDGQVTLSRWPLQEPQMLFFDIPYGTYDQDAISDFSEFPAGVGKSVTSLPNGRLLSIFNLHGPVDLDGMANSSRRQSMMNLVVAQVRLALAAGHAIILGGDTNAQAANPCFESLKPLLKPAFPAGTLRTTFNMKRKTNPGYAQAAVDALWLSFDIELLSAECLDVDVSDHLPLLTTLRVSG